MGKNELEDFHVQNFEEVPNGYLLVDNNSNYFYIKYLSKSFVAIQNIDLVTIDKIDCVDRIVIEKSYYDVRNGDFILEDCSIYSITEKEKVNSNIDKDTKIIPLSDMLNIKENGILYLSLDDINNIINLYEKKKKIYYKK